VVARDAAPESSTPNIGGASIRRSGLDLRDVHRSFGDLVAVDGVSFPHAPSTFLLTEIEGKGGTALSCSSTPSGRKAKSCLAPQATATPHRAPPARTTPG
jgi:hypothetical protein